MPLRQGKQQIRINQHITFSNRFSNSGFRPWIGKLRFLRFSLSSVTFILRKLYRVASTKSETRIGRRTAQTAKSHASETYRPASKLSRILTRFRKTRLPSPSGNAKRPDSRHLLLSHSFLAPIQLEKHYAKTRSNYYHKSSYTQIILHMSTSV